MVNYLPVRANAFHELVKNLINTVVVSITDVGRYFFCNRATLGFIGSSIVEGANPGIKTGDFASKSTMCLDTSSLQQVKQVKICNMKLNLQMARELNANEISKL